MLFAIFDSYDFMRYINSIMILWFAQSFEMWNIFPIPDHFISESTTDYYSFYCGPRFRINGFDIHFLEHIIKLNFVLKHYDTKKIMITIYQHVGSLHQILWRRMYKGIETTFCNLKIGKMNIFVQNVRYHPMWKNDVTCLIKIRS